MRFLNYLAEQKIPHDVPLSKVLRVFKHFDFNIIRETPHIVMRNKSGLSISIPNHKQIKSTTLRKIIGEAGLDRNMVLNAF
jgi:hypothetical protein